MTPVPVQVLVQMPLCPLEQMPLYASFVFVSAILSLERGWSTRFKPKEKRFHRLQGKHFAITFATWVWLANESDGCSRSKGTGKHSVSLMVFLAAFTLIHVLVFAQSKSTSKPSVSLMIFLAAFTIINVLFFYTSQSDRPSGQQQSSELPVATDGTFLATIMARESSPGWVR